MIWRDSITTVKIVAAELYRDTCQQIWRRGKKQAKGDSEEGINDYQLPDVNRAKTSKLIGVAQVHAVASTHIGVLVQTFWHPCLCTCRHLQSITTTAAVKHNAKIRRRGTVKCDTLIASWPSYWRQHDWVCMGRRPATRQLVQTGPVGSECRTPMNLWLSTDKHCQLREIHRVVVYAMTKSLSSNDLTEWMGTMCGINIAFRTWSTSWQLRWRSRKLYRHSTVTNHRLASILDTSTKSSRQLSATNNFSSDAFKVCMDRQPAPGKQSRTSPFTVFSQTATQARKS